MNTAERQRRVAKALEKANQEQAREIERLRTAMVLAMADCETEANLSKVPTTRRVLLSIAAGLRKALERK